MSSNSESSVTEKPVEIIFQREGSTSSEEPPMEEWSSLILPAPPDPIKLALFKEGLYHPGSGEICTKYFPMSDSDVFRHPYYNYPGIKDPGIVEALLDPEPRKIYDTDGQELYLDKCKEMNVIPVRSFYKGLLEEYINLRYYCVNPVGVRAMCMALSYNRFVKRIDLTSNFLSEDACYHLGQLLYQNDILQELVLSQCKIQSRGLRNIAAGLSSRTMELLDLSKNDIKDDGFQYLAEKITKGAVIKRLNLSNNNLGPETAEAFSEALTYNNSIVTLDMSWNKLYPLKESNDLLRELGKSKVLTSLNMSWNGLTNGIILRRVVSVGTLRYLDLSNNRLSSGAVKWIGLGLQAAKKLHTLDLSYNPFTPNDAVLLLDQMKKNSVTLQNLLMDGISVTKEFVQELQTVLSLSFRAKTKISYGKVLKNYTITLPDMRPIVMKRIDFLTSKGYKKKSTDIALYFLEKAKTCDAIQIRELMRDMKIAGTPVDDTLSDAIASAFPGPKTQKGANTISLGKITDYIHRIWPDKKLPPTPPPEIIEPKKKKGKEKKKK